MRRRFHNLCMTCVSISVILFSTIPLSAERQLDRKFFVPKQEYADYANTDYFQKNSDLRVQALLENVERNHFSRTNFWAGFAQGASDDYGLKDLQYVLWVFPNHPRGLSVMVMVAKTIGKPNLPLSYFKKALQLFPGYALTHAQFGAYLRDINQHAQAIKELKLATKIDPSLAIAYVWLAEAYFKAEQMDLGKRAAQKARELGYKKKIIGEENGHDGLKQQPD